MADDCFIEQELKGWKDLGELKGKPVKNLDEIKSLLNLGEEAKILSQKRKDFLGEYVIYKIDSKEKSASLIAYQCDHCNTIRLGPPKIELNDMDSLNVGPLAGTLMSAIYRCTECNHQVYEEPLIQS